MKQCDLHTHSNCSDGSFSPAELVRAADAIGLTAIALTDHNTTKGLRAFLDAGLHSNVQTVAGCEFSTDYQGRELHIVGLFLPEDAWDQVEVFVSQLQTAKRESNLQLIANLQAAGYQLTFAEVAATTDADAFNRAHVAQVLCTKGYVSSVKEAFQTILREEQGYYIPPKRPDAFAAVRFIRSIGGAAVLAHPFLNLDTEGLMQFLPEAKENGLDAVEVYYTEFDETMTAEIKQIAARFGLLESGGSDFHGTAKPDIALGKRRGTIFVQDANYQKLPDREAGSDRK